MVDFPKYKFILENLYKKLQHVVNTCGSGLIHDARQNHRNVGYYVEYCNKFINKEQVMTFFDGENNDEEYKDCERHPMTERAFEIRVNNIIKSAEDFLDFFSKTGAVKFW